MKRKYIIGIDGSGVDEFIKGLEEYQKWINRKAEELAKRLADKGYEFAYQVMSGHVFTGETLASLTVEKLSQTSYVVKAASKALLFFEFGAGVNGGGHPLDGELGFGPGTYPGQKHAFDTGGWWYPTDDPALIVRTDKQGQGWGHSYGNPPYMPMYGAVKSLEQDFKDIVQEVFGNGS